MDTFRFRWALRTIRKNLRKEEKVTLNLIKELLEERFNKHGKTILTFISDNNKLIHEKLDSINRRIDDQNERIQALENLKMVNLRKV